jgi:hypothetical protein
VLTSKCLGDSRPSKEHLQLIVHSLLLTPFNYVRANKNVGICSSTTHMSFTRKGSRSMGLL